MEQRDITSDERRAALQRAWSRNSTALRLTSGQRKAIVDGKAAKSTVRPS